MARGPRLDCPGSAHHVMIRGIEGRHLFFGNEDRGDFLERLDRLLPEADWRCFAWALLPNHAHLILQGARGGLSRLMARLNTGYARSFNARHGRKGYLFQNRFKSRLAQDERDLTGLVLYVNRNPLVAGLVDSTEALERYPWCGHATLMGIRAPRRFESVGATLSLFAERPDEARRRVRAWTRDPTAPVADGFLDEALDEHARAEPGPAEQASPGAGAGTDFDERTVEVLENDDPVRRILALVSAVSRLLGVPVADICSASPQRAPARARAAIAYLAVEELGLPGRATAAALRISPSAVSHAMRRGKAVAREERLRIVGA